MSQPNPRKKLIELFKKYWWILVIITGVLVFTTNASIFKYVLWGIGIIFLIFIFAPFFFQLFGPSLFLISSLGEHFNKSKGQSPGKRYVLIPAALVAAVGFTTAQSILSIWVLIITFLIWSSVVGSVIAFITIFFFGLAPFAIFTAPIVVWIQSGFISFLDVVTFFLIALFWYGFSKIADSQDYWKTTPESYLGYSPNIFLLGALSFQVIATPFYQFSFYRIGNFLSDTCGFLFLIFALVSVFTWNSRKKKLSEEERANLYKPSAWIYFFGFILTSLIYAQFKEQFGAPTSVLLWLNTIFFIALIIRFIGIFKQKKKLATQTEKIS